MSEASPPPHHFKLSRVFRGHGDDVRAVRFPRSTTVISSSRDTTVRIWRQEPDEYQWDARINYMSSSFVNALAYIKAEDAEDDMIVSGGQDKLIILTPAKGKDVHLPSAVLAGHENNVCALDANFGLIASGSWDGTARIWQDAKQKHLLRGHGNSVWAVLLISEDEVLTASADKTIKLWRQGKLVSTFVGHTDVVRGLCIVPGEGFASCSNDGTIRVWDLKGDTLYTCFGHTSFVYCVDSLPTGEIVSSGEDRTFRVWKDRECIQVVTIPCLSIWSVSACQESGDIAVGSSDGVIRTFTRDHDRRASIEDSEKFQQEIKNSSISAAELGHINKERLPGPEELTVPGSKEGQILLIRTDLGKIEAHQWTGGKWEAVGEVVDTAGSQQKQVYNGKEYDYVFDVDVDDQSAPLKLPYNVQDNPYDAAKSFLDDNELPASYLDQTASFIMDAIKGVSIGNQAPAPDPYSTGRYIPGQGNCEHANTAVPVLPAQIIPQTTFLSIAQGNVMAIQAKILEWNDKVDDAVKLTDDEVIIIKTQVAMLHSKIGAMALLTPAAKVAEEWPPAAKLPGLDLMRLVIPVIEEVPQKVFYLLLDTPGIMSPDYPNNLMLAIRCMVNAFATPVGRQALEIFFRGRKKDMLSRIKEAWPKGQPSRNLLVASATLMLNISVFHLKQPSTSCLIRPRLVLEFLYNFLEEEKEPESVYRSLIALGTLLSSSLFTLSDVKVTNDDKEKITRLLNKIKEDQSEHRIEAAVQVVNQTVENIKIHE